MALSIVIYTAIRWIPAIHYALECPAWNWGGQKYWSRHVRVDFCSIQCPKAFSLALARPAMVASARYDESCFVRCSSMTCSALGTAGMAVPARYVELGYVSLCSACLGWVWQPSDSVGNIVCDFCAGEGRSWGGFWCKVSARNHDGTDDPYSCKAELRSAGDFGEVVGPDPASPLTSPPRWCPWGPVGTAPCTMCMPLDAKEGVAMGHGDLRLDLISMPDLKWPKEKCANTGISPGDLLKPTRVLRGLTSSAGWTCSFLWFVSILIRTQHLPLYPKMDQVRQSCALAPRSLRNNSCDFCTVHCYSEDFCTLLGYTILFLALGRPATAVARYVDLVYV
ncbi:hypothetical protein WN48_09774 [Eufriesea mexicana]|uniref:Uncharacterized protein n=1 Tax=Eufriesea mexicana TaxID=516756 RepID=A0A310S729_9HYME|nr:hypothetical protein WN48_09774 [Eufriesea mexicana]